MTNVWVELMLSSILSFPTTLPLADSIKLVSIAHAKNMTAFKEAGMDVIKTMIHSDSLHCDAYECIQKHGLYMNKPNAVFEQLLTFIMNECLADIEVYRAFAHLQSHSQSQSQYAKFHQELVSYCMSRPTTTTKRIPMLRANFDSENFTGTLIEKRRTHPLVVEEIIKSSKIARHVLINHLDIDVNMTVYPSLFASMYPDKSAFYESLILKCKAFFEKFETTLTNVVPYSYDDIEYHHACLDATDDIHYQSSKHSKLYEVQTYDAIDNAQFTKHCMLNEFQEPILSPDTAKNWPDHVAVVSLETLHESRETDWTNFQSNNTINGMTVNSHPSIFTHEWNGVIHEAFSQFKSVSELVIKIKNFEIMSYSLKAANKFLVHESNIFAFYSALGLAHRDGDDVGAQRGQADPKAHLPTPTSDREKEKIGIIIDTFNANSINANSNNNFNAIAASAIANNNFNAITANSNAISLSMSRSRSLSLPPALVPDREKIALIDAPI